MICQILLTFAQKHACEFINEIKDVFEIRTDKWNTNHSVRMQRNSRRRHHIERKNRIPNFISWLSGKIFRDLCCALFSKFKTLLDTVRFDFPSEKIFKTKTLFQFHFIFSHSWLVCKATCRTTWQSFALSANWKIKCSLLL